jgi:hypothetical protein
MLFSVKYKYFLYNRSTLKISQLTEKISDRTIHPQINQIEIIDSLRS